MKATFPKLSVTLFLIVLITILTVGFFSFVKLQQLMEATRMLSHATRVIAKSEEVLKSVVDVETSMRGYMITNDSAYLEPYLNALQILPRMRLELDSMVSRPSSHANQKHELNQLNQLIKRRVRIAETSIQAANRGFELARALVIQGDGKRVMDSMRFVVEKIQNNERTFFQANSGISDGYLRQFQVSLLGLLAIVIAIISFLFIVIKRQIKARDQSLTDMHRASSEIKDLYDHAPCGYLSVGSDIFLANINQTLLGWLGYSFDEVVGKMKFEELLSPASRQKFLSDFERDFEQYKKVGHVNNLEFEFLRKDNSTFTVILNSIAIFDEAGNFIKSRSTVFDNTERKKAEKEITHLANLIENSYESIYSVTPDFQIRTWNKGAENLYGYTASEAVGKTVFEIVRSRMDDENRLSIRKHLIERGRWEGELEHLQRDGSIKHVLASAVAIYNEKGEPDGYVSVAQDITARKEDEQRLHESEEKFNKAFQASPAGIIITRLSDSRIVEVNESLCRMIGSNKEELIGNTAEGAGLVIDPEKSKHVYDLINAQGHVSNIEMDIKNREEKVISVIYSAQLVTLKTESHVLTVVYDISELKKAERKINKLNKELEAFTYSVSHDLRAPLRSIDGYARILEEDYASQLDVEGRRVISTITRNANRMGRLIDDMLTLSRLDRIETSPVHLNMKEVVDNIVSELLEFDRNKNLDIQISDLHSARADLDMIRQVWINFIGNAIKYSGKKPDVMIEIGSHAQAEEIVYYVKDNGTGFDQQYAHKLFGVFQRLHKQEEFEGTGVGLAICKRVVERHMGRVWAEGKVGAGASFYFSLPRNQ
jgi:PAS domain S-box-containing protein